VSFEHVEASSEISIEYLASEILDDLSTVIASIIGDDSGELLKSLSVSLDSECLFALNTLG
jgi:hypothetical protein